MALIITQNTTWSDDAPITLTDDVQVAAGATLTIEPGATIIGNGFDIQSFGTVQAIGAADDVTKFRNVDLNFGGNLFDSSAPPGRIEISFADIEGGELLDVFPQGKGSISLTDSLLENVIGFEMTHAGEESIIARNVFLTSEGIELEALVENNAFFDQRPDVFGSSAAILGDSTDITAQYNSFLTTSKTAMEVDNGTITATENFFNTTDLALINQMILDRNDSLSRDTFVSNSFIFAPHQDTPTGLQYSITDLSGVAGFLYGGIGQYAIGGEVTIANRTYRIASIQYDYSESQTGAIDVVGTAAAESLQGGTGDDSLNGGLGQDTLDGGDGVDFADYQEATQSVSVDFGFGFGSGAEIGLDFYTNIEAAFGGSGNDTLNGWTGNDFLSGLGGNDIIYGQGGSDVLLAGSGDDIVVSGDGDDFADGAGGADTLYGQAGADTLLGGDGTDYADGGEGNDSLNGGDDADNVQGGLGNDTVNGGSGADFVGGSEGDDFLNGSDGQDILVGGTGADTLFGGLDHDWDRIQSQTEATGVTDVFVLNSPGDQALGNYDQFENFEIGVDRIQALSANSFADIAFSNYPGQGVKIVNVVDGSAAFLLGIQQNEVQAEWFIFS